MFERGQVALHHRLAHYNAKQLTSTVADRSLWTDADDGCMEGPELAKRHLVGRRDTGRHAREVNDRANHRTKYRYTKCCSKTTNAKSRHAVSDSSVRRPY